jgi:hypothetical protein
MADWINKSKIMDTIREKCSTGILEKNIPGVYSCVIALALNQNDATLPITEAYATVYYWGLLSLVADLADNHRDYIDLLIREDL